MSLVVVPQGEDRYALWETSEDRIAFWDCTEEEAIAIVGAEYAAVGRRAAAKAIEHAKATGRARYGPVTWEQAVQRHEERYPPLLATGIEVQAAEIVAGIEERT